MTHAELILDTISELSGVPQAIVNEILQHLKHGNDIVPGLHDELPNGIAKNLKSLYKSYDSIQNVSFQIREFYKEKRHMFNQ